MCGIAGMITLDKSSVDRCLVEEINESQKHRGPDDEGVFVSMSGHVVLAHRRLAIIDLSNRGHQPMLDPEKRVVVVFNGEIYNYIELRNDLRKLGFCFRSNSDTEVILNAYNAYGEDCVKRFDGMFSFALYDLIKDQMIIARDPMGVKPLYYYKDDKSVVFASELKSLAENLQRRLSLNYQALYEYLSQNYIYGEHTIYKEIKNLPPGYILRIGQDGKICLRNYLDRQIKVKNGGLKSAADEFESLFEEEVKRSVRSDVPVGIFLSGGIDSALLGSLISKYNSNLTAFTIGFHGADFDEAKIARRVSNYFGFNHKVHYLEVSDFASVLDKIISAFGQPFGDFSSLPTYFVSSLARRNGIKVVLSGDGADDVFGGYPTAYLPAVLNYYGILPLPIRKALSGLAKILPASHKKLGVEEKIKRFTSGGLYNFQEAHFFWKMIFSLDDIRQLLNKDFFELFFRNCIDDGFLSYFKETEGYYNNKIDQTIMVDSKTFLPYNCLVKVDVCSMLESIEVRVPFLNQRVVDFAYNLPTNYKASIGKTKILLRHVLKNRLPNNVYSLKKMGFTPPLSIWLKNELKDYMINSFSDGILSSIGIFNQSYINNLLNNHLSGREDNTRRIWGLISLVRFFSKNPTLIK